jgi:hypothetical protein
MASQQKSFTTDNPIFLAGRPLKPDITPQDLLLIRSHCSGGWAMLIMNRLLTFVIVLAAVNVPVLADLVNEASLSDFTKSDTIVMVAAAVFKKPANPSDDVASVHLILGQILPTEPFAFQAEPLADDAKQYILFYRHTNSGLVPISRDCYIIGCSDFGSGQKKSLAAGDISTFLAQSIYSETEPQCALQQSYLLAQSADTKTLSACWESISARKSQNPLIALADINIGLRARGVAALQSFDGPVTPKDDTAGGLFELRSEAQLRSWLFRNAAPDNHEQILKFALMQNDSLKGSCLAAISKYVTLSDASTIAQVFVNNASPDVAYSCLLSLSRIFDRPIPTKEQFIPQKDALLKDWTEFLKGEGVL